MKNEKFCFSKGTGLIALVGIVLVGLVIVMTNLPSTSTSTKAAGTTCRAQGGNWYADADCAAVASRFATPFNAAVSPSDAAIYASSVCCVPARTPAAIGKTCKALGGNWYSDANCDDLATRMKTAFTVPGDTPNDQALWASKVCCVGVKAAASTVTGKTCKALGGNWYSDA
ncbi:MAG: hypothetical protein NTV98_02250, partial [Candidatus Roizmanbacteria bacterium]|nr:hypothetical protein [Candidatus Roizmanbacteria bacterium]